MIEFLDGFVSGMVTMCLILLLGLLVAAMIGKGKR